MKWVQEKPMHNMPVDAQPKIGRSQASEQPFANVFQNNYS